MTIDIEFSNVTASLLDVVGDLKREKFVVTHRRSVERKNVGCFCGICLFV